MGSLPSRAPVLAPPGGGRDDCLLDVTQGRRARVAASTRLVTSSVRRMSERWTLAFSVLMNSSCRSHRWTDRGRAARAPLVLAGRETEHHRSVLVAPWVGGSVPADGQTGAVGEIVDGGQQRCRVEFLGRGAGGAEGVGGGAPCRGGRDRPSGLERFGMASDHLSQGASGHTASPRSTHRPTRTRDPRPLGTRGELRAPGATCRLPPHPRSTPRPTPPRPRRPTAARRAISARGQPTSDPSPAPCSHSRAPDPGCHDTQASVRPVGRAHGPRGRPNRGGCRSCALLRIWFNSRWQKIHGRLQDDRSRRGLECTTRRAHRSPASSGRPPPGPQATRAQMPPCEA